MAGLPCERCGRVVVDQSTDFGGLLLKPTCNGVQVKVQATNGLWREVCWVTADELREFLRRAYGDPSGEAARRRAMEALGRFDGRAWAGASRSEVVDVVIGALNGQG